MFNGCFTGAVSDCEFSISEIHGRRPGSLCAETGSHVGPACPRPHFKRRDADAHSVLAGSACRLAEPQDATLGRQAAYVFPSSVRSKSSSCLSKLANAKLGCINSMSSTSQKSMRCSQSGKRSCISGRCSLSCSAITRSALFKASIVQGRGKRLRFATVTPRARKPSKAKGDIKPMLLLPRSSARPRESARQFIAELTVRWLNSSSANRLR